MTAKPLRDLSEAEIRRYDDDGVIHTRGLFDPEWVELIREACEENLENPSPRARETAGADGQGRFHSDIWCSQHNPKFWDYVFKSPAAEIASQVMRCDSVYFFYDQPFVKLPNTPAETDWHNDLPFWPFKAVEGITSIWMAANDFSAEVSGLEFVRGSHKWNKRYLAITVDRDPAFMKSGLPPCPNFSELRDEYDVLSWDMHAGDALIFNTMVVHGASGNPSKTVPRISLSTRWLSPEAIWENRPSTVGEFMPQAAHLPNDQSIGDPIFRDVLPLVWNQGREVAVKQPWLRPPPLS